MPGDSGSVRAHIEIRVRVHGHLVWYLPGKRERLQVTMQTGATVGDILETLEVPAAEILAISVGGRRVQLDCGLQDGDTVELIPVLSGG